MAKPTDVVMLKFREIYPTGNRRSHALFTSRNFGCPWNCLYCTITPKIYPQHCAHTAPVFHPNRFAFGEVI